MDTYGDKFTTTHAQEDATKFDGSIIAGYGSTIFVDANCYTVKIVWRGFADVGRPNTRRPAYIKTVVKEPAIYRMAGGVIICHPIFVEKLQKVAKEAQQRIADRVDAMVFGMLASKPVPAPREISKADHLDSLKSILESGTISWPKPTPSPFPVEIQDVIDDQGPTLTFSRFYKDMFALGISRGPFHIDGVS